MFRSDRDTGTICCCLHLSLLKEVLWLITACRFSWSLKLRLIWSDNKPKEMKEVSQEHYISIYPYVYLYANMRLSLALQSISL